MNGKPALLYYVSPTQINALTPLDSTTGQVAVTVNNGASTASFTANLRTVITGVPAVRRRRTHDRHPRGRQLPGSNIFGQCLHARQTRRHDRHLRRRIRPAVHASGKSGSRSQSGPLPTLPDCQISGSPATVAFAGLNGFAGLYQLNLVVPSTAPNGDNQVSCTYGGQSTPPAPCSPSIDRALMWRAHSCVPRRDSSRRLIFQQPLQRAGPRFISACLARSINSAALKNLSKLI